jgi:hypothetical protein
MNKPKVLAGSQEAFSVRRLPFVKRSFDPEISSLPGRPEAFGTAGKQ